jgi:hypothetical protein
MVEKGSNSHILISFNISLLSSFILKFSYNLVRAITFYYRSFWRKIYRVDVPPSQLGGFTSMNSLILAANVTPSPLRFVCPLNGSSFNPIQLLNEVGIPIDVKMKSRKQ